MGRSGATLSHPWSEPQPGSRHRALGRRARAVEPVCGRPSRWTPRRLQHHGHPRRARRGPQGFRRIHEGGLVGRIVARP